MSIFSNISDLNKSNDPSKMEEPSHALGSGLEDAMEGILALRGKKIVKLEDLTPAMRKQILDHKPDVYNIADISGLDTICDLRGRDVPSKWTSQHVKYACVVATSKNFDTKHTFIGPSINVAKGKAEGDTAGKNMDKVTMRFHLDTQTPNIQITTRLNGTDASLPDDMVSTRIYAHDLVLDDALNARIYAIPPEDSTDRRKNRFERKGAKPGNGDVDDLKSILGQKRLLELMIVIKPGRKAKHWTGITGRQATQIIDGTMGSGHGTEQTTTRDQLMNQMGRDDTSVVSFYIMVGAYQVEAFDQQMDYIRNLFTVAARHGNFWFYRHQLYLRKMDPNLLEKAVLPDINFETPRWLANEFEFDTVTNENGLVEYSNPQPYFWGHHNLPRSWSNPDEAAFLLKMGIDGERRRQGRDLRELGQSDKLYFRGRFEPVEGFPGRFLCSFFLQDNPAVEERTIRMPGIGTRLRIMVDPENPKEPNAKSAATYHGTVTSDPFNSKAAFICMLHGPKKITKAPLPIYISYLVDTVPYMRQLAAVNQIQEINSNNKPTGVDLKRLFFNDESYADGTDWFEKNLDRAKFEAAIAKRPKGKQPNDSQMRAILGTAESLTGFAGIQGPPGTGKTETVKTISMATLACGFKILLCVPTNAAVAHLAQSFDKSCEDEGWLEKHEHVLFTGALVSISSAEKLIRQKEVAQQMDLAASHDKEALSVVANAENMVQQHARAVLLSTVVSDANLTFGYKLRERIQFWAESSPDAAHSMRAKANVYLCDLRQLPYEPIDSKQALLDRLDDYEYNLGMWYLEHEVKAVFCTNSSSAHELLSRAYKPQMLIVDEAAAEGLAGLATPAGAFKNSLKHITLAGDHKQGKPIFAAGDSNVGHGMLSRNLFIEVAEEVAGQHKFTALQTSYRCVKDLLNFTKRFYNNLGADASCGRIEQLLVATLKAFWTSHLRKSFTGKHFQVAINVKGQHNQKDGSTTKTNNAEAKAIAYTVKAMLGFEPPQGGRQILPSDIGIVANYTGAVLDIEHELVETLGWNTATQIKVNTVNHAQGSEWNIVLFSCVIALGVDRVRTKDSFPIGFVANANSINVALSRARVGRYIFGALHEMVQMVLDRHTAAVNSRYKPFFDHLKQLADNDQIVTEEEWAHALVNGQPADDAHFAQPHQFKKGLIEPAKDRGKRKGRKDNTGDTEGEAQSSESWLKPSETSAFKFVKGGKSLTSTAMRSEPKFSGEAEHENPSKFHRGARGARGGRGGSRGDRGRGRGENIGG